MQSLVMHKSNEQSEAGVPSSTEASSPPHLVARQLLVTYCGSELLDAKLPGSKLSETAIQIVCDYIEANLCTQLTLEDLAALVYLSPFHFARCFKASMGLAPHQYVIARRMELAKRLILTTTINVAEIAWSIGYENISHFRRLFTMHIGMTPGEIRRAGIELGDNRKNRPSAA
jgi:AraC family transcriptional regulator